MKGVFFVVLYVLFGVCCFVCVVWYVLCVVWYVLCVVCCGLCVVCCGLFSMFCLVCVVCYLLCVEATVEEITRQSPPAHTGTCHMTAASIASRNQLHKPGSTRHSLMPDLHTHWDRLPPKRLGVLKS